MKKGFKKYLQRKGSKAIKGFALQKGCAILKKTKLKVILNSKSGSSSQK